MIAMTRGIQSVANERFGLKSGAGMRRSPRIKACSSVVVHRQPWSWTHGADEIEEDIGVVRMPLLRGFEMHGGAFLQRCERADLAKEDVLGGEAPPQRLRRALQPREDTLIADAPLGEQIKAVGQKPMGY